MLLKESKIRVLENFYALDYVFFGKSVNKVDTCCPLVREEYLSIKGALLSVFVEMLRLVEHKPKTLSEKVDGKSLLKTARQTAKMARENSQKIVMTAKARANIKESLKESLKEDPEADIAKLVETQIRQKAFRLAADNLMLARIAGESRFDKLNDWEGRIVEDSYKILRDNLVEAAYQIIYDDIVTEEEDKKKVSEATIKYSVSKIIALARKHGSIVEKQGKAGCEKWSVKAPFKGQEYRDKMMACKAKAAIKGLNASAMFAKKLTAHCSSGEDCKKKIYAFLVDIKSEIKDNQSYVK